MEELHTTLSTGIRFLLRRQLGPEDLNDKVHDVFVIVTQAILLAAAGKGAISADRRGPRRQCSVAATGHRLRWNWFQKEKILTDRQ
jgi:hypothetical protein